VSARPHATYLAALVATLVAAAAMPVVGHLLQARDAAAQDRMTEIATSMRTPQGFVPDRGCALQGAGAVRCGHAPGSPRAVAEQARSALAAAAGEPITLACDRFPDTPGDPSLVPVGCSVRFEHGGHDVLVTVRSRTALATGTASGAGADYLVQVS
jgi:hypothetical protein